MPSVMRGQISRATGSTVQRRSRSSFGLMTAASPPLIVNTEALVDERKEQYSMTTILTTVLGDVINLVSSLVGGL
jgi:hypothetical protein